MQTLFEHPVQHNTGSTNALIFGQGFLFGWPIPDGGVFENLFEIIIFAIPFDDGSGTKLTHLTFNLGTLISSSKTANFSTQSIPKKSYMLSLNFFEIL